MSEKRYVCEGSCGGSVTEEEYKEGKTNCEDDSCENHGKPLVEKCCDDGECKGCDPDEGCGGCCGCR